jgi:DNA-binding NarL/FixJ family response regulator
MIRILIADPDSATRKALSSLLQRKLGSNTIIDVENIETLIRQLADTPPDLLVLDWRLNGSPAPEICKLVHKAYPLLKIILLSVDANDANAAREAGAIFIHKGASPDELITILKPLLAQGSTKPQNSELTLKVEKY